MISVVDLQTIKRTVSGTKHFVVACPAMDHSEEERVAVSGGQLLQSTDTPMVCTGTGPH